VIVTLYHAIVPNWGLGQLGPRAPWPDGFREVARVQIAGDPTPDQALEEAWSQTQHMDRPWWDNPSVELVGPRTARSTSIGDVAIVGGSRYTCGAVGWTRAEEGG
jgi:hypothetical protein